MDKRTDGITPIFERNLAIMVMYLPVKFEIDWIKHFRVRVQKWKCSWRDKRTKTGQTELHQFRQEPSYDGDVSSCKV